MLIIIAAVFDGKVSSEDAMNELATTLHFKDIVDSVIEPNDQLKELDLIQQAHSYVCAIVYYLINLLLYLILFIRLSKRLASLSSSYFLQLQHVPSLLRYNYYKLFYCIK